MSGTFGSFILLVAWAQRCSGTQLLQALLRQHEETVSAGQSVWSCVEHLHFLSRR